MQRKQLNYNWSKDMNNLASLASKVITESYEDGEDKDAEYLAAHDELPESQDDLDRHEAIKSEDGEDDINDIDDILELFDDMAARDSTIMDGLSRVEQLEDGLETLVIKFKERLERAQYLDHEPDDWSDVDLEDMYQPLMDVIGNMISDTEVDWF
jgi:hypothetical protein